MPANSCHVRGWEEWDGLTTVTCIAAASSRARAKVPTAKARRGCLSGSQSLHTRSVAPNDRPVRMPREWNNGLATIQPRYRPIIQVRYLPDESSAASKQMKAKRNVVDASTLVH